MFFFLMIRRPPRSTLDRSSAASDVYKRQREFDFKFGVLGEVEGTGHVNGAAGFIEAIRARAPVSYTHLRAHETVLDLVCRLLLEKNKTYIIMTALQILNEPDYNKSSCNSLVYCAKRQQKAQES